MKILSDILNVAFIIFVLWNPARSVGLYLYRKWNYRYCVSFKYLDFSDMAIYGHKHWLENKHIEYIVEAAESKREPEIRTVVFKFKKQQDAMLFTLMRK